MATNLFDSIIFGPIQSRRLGVSLGVNLLPTDYKVCTFDCVYCECGFTPSHYVPSFEPEEKVVAELESVLKNRKEKNEPLDVITFAGNGEPTMHPKFASIIEKTIELRNLYFPDSQISVLSNATMLNRQSVVDALKKVDNNILKIDAGINATAKIIDRPCSKSYNVNKITDQMLQFDGDFIMQTMFIRGTAEGVAFDNTTEEEVSEWIKLVEKTHPKQIMIYSVDRDTPVQTLSKVGKEEMETIAQRLREMGFSVSVA